MVPLELEALYFLVHFSVCVNSKSWKLVFRGFPYMGMFD